MKFDFGTFMQNFTQAAINGARVYEAKQEEGKSLHSADYVNLGIMGMVAILSAFSGSDKTEQPETPERTGTLG